MSIREFENKVKMSVLSQRIILFDHLMNNEVNESIDLYCVNFHSIILCKRGSAKLYIDGQFYEMNAGDLFVCRPQQMLKHQWRSDDLEFIGIAVEPDFAVRNLSLLNPNSWDLKYFLERHPLIHLSVDEATDIELLLHLLKRKTAQGASVFNERLLQSMMTTFFLQIAGIINQHNGEVRDMLFTSGEAIFHRFIELLNNDYPRQRSVESYAARLCISSKYLSAVCKKVSGKTALHIIREYVMKDIRYALMHREKSIKEISFELNFPNISFFGKYVKDCMGESPRQLRRRLLSHGPIEGGGTVEEGETAL